MGSAARGRCGVPTGSARRRSPANLSTAQRRRTGDFARPRWGRRCAAVAALAVAAFTLLPAPSAAAHPTLQATTPPAGYSVMEAPREITLDFGEPVGLVPDALRLTASDRQLATSPAALSENGRRVNARVDETLPPDLYQVAWQVRADDGDLVSGGFFFAVGVSVVDGDAGAPIGGAGGTAPLNAPAAALRWVLFAALAIGLGGAGGRLLADRIRREVTAAGDVVPVPLPAPMLTGAVLGLTATSGLILLGGYGIAEVLGSHPGRLLGVELAGFAASAGLAGLSRILGRPRLHTASVAPLLAVVGAEAMRAHVSALHPLAGGLLTAVHLLAAALWIGGLLQVLRVALRWRRAGWARLLLFDYARVALWLAIAVIATGIVQGLLLVPTAADLLGTDYGQVLLAKLAVVVLVLGCAVLARRALHARLRRDRDSKSRPMGRPVWIEMASLVTVLALTGVLTSLTPPAQAIADVALPPPPLGPAVPVGTLAGQVTVAATASDGRLVVRLSTPLDGPFDQPPESPSYRLTAQATPGEELALLSCGTGCFVASVDWQPGTTTFTLDVTAAPWTGGRSTLDVPWPPRPASDRLDQVLATMRAAGPFTLREAVTSDYQGDPGAFDDLPTTGVDFIAREPYADGAINPVVVSTPDGDQLAFAFPANGIVVQLWLEGDRIVREVLISPNHLITRVFDYP